MGHNHGLGIDHREEGSKRKLLSFRLGLVLLIGLTAFCVQLFGSLLTGSVALLADTFHLLTDTVAIAVAFAVSLLGLSSKRSTDGLWRAKLEARAALLQSVLLLAVGAYALLRGLRGFKDSHVLSGEAILFFASLGLLANIAGMAILYSSRKDNLNARAAFLEVLTDGLGSLAVVASALAVLWFGFFRADAIAALIIGVLVVPRALRLLFHSLRQLKAAKLLRRSMAIGAILLSLVAAVGLSKLHQAYSPTVYEEPPAAVDSYSWSKGDSTESLALSFDSEERRAIFSSGCATAEAHYELVFGGVRFGALEDTTSPSCGVESPVLQSAAYGFYGKDMRTLELSDRDFSALDSLESAAREADVKLLEEWRPIWEFIFAL